MNSGTLARKGATVVLIKDIVYVTYVYSLVQYFTDLARQI